MRPGEEERLYIKLSLALYPGNNHTLNELSLEEEEQQCHRQGGKYASCHQQIITRQLTNSPDRGETGQELGDCKELWFLDIKKWIKEVVPGAIESENGQDGNNWCTHGYDNP